MVGKKKIKELVFVATNQVVATRELNSVKFFLMPLQFSRKKRKKSIIFKKKRRKSGKRGRVGYQVNTDKSPLCLEDMQIIKTQQKKELLIFLNAQ
jgi:hypothetical protein